MPAREQFRVVNTFSDQFRIVECRASVADSAATAAILSIAIPAIRQRDVAPLISSKFHLEVVAYA
jgi:hypothetical protein